MKTNQLKLVVLFCFLSVINVVAASSSYGSDGGSYQFFLVVAGIFTVIGIIVWLVNRNKKE